MYWFRSSLKLAAFLVPVAAGLVACGTSSEDSVASQELDKINQMQARFAPVVVTADTMTLSEGDKQALQKLLEAAQVIDDLYIRQVWSGNEDLYRGLKETANSPEATELDKARLRYFVLNKGPWSELDNFAPFIPGVPDPKPAGANFYPEDMTREEFEAWVATLSPAEQEEARGFFTLIRRGPDGELQAIGYNHAYLGEIDEVARRLDEAAALTTNESLAEYLRLRAAGFRTNNYYDSDVAWMKVDAPIDVTIGPYETYMDQIFGYKAAFEAYITLRDDEETAKLQIFTDHIQEVENNLPIDAQYRNPKLGALAPIRVVNEILASGDGAHGVRTAAFNLPNDERVTLEYGSKRVMLKNVQEAKFQTTLDPISQRVLPAADLQNVSFNAFFTHILAHEMSHGIGPHEGVRESLKELHAAIEEAKADITGLYMLQYLMDQQIIPGGEQAERELYTTFLASSFRTLRFGVHEAHGRGMAMQVNYLTDKGAFVVNDDGTFAVDFTKIKGGVRDLVHDLLMLEANGDYAGAQKMLNELGVLRPPLDIALAKLTDIPTDIDPVRELPEPPGGAQ